MNVQQGVPTLLQQVLAARIPSKRQQAAGDRLRECEEQVYQAVLSIGNASFGTVKKATGLGERTVRGTLAELVKAGRLTTWVVQKGCCKMNLWAVTTPPRRRK